ncbi:MAG TPA: CD225/dispanin family protein [Nitriliruptorales bacterium]|jgi:hypothetical protein
MSDEEGSSPPPGWYPDPSSGGQRYWDGSRWTEYTDQNYPQQAAAGGGAPVQGVDPWLWQSIVATVLCCLPFGIAGIVFAARANADIRAGNQAGAVENAQKARMWTLISVAVGLAVLVIYLLIFAFATSSTFEIQ